MKVLIITKDFGKKKSNLNILIEKLKQRNIEYAVLNYNDVENFYIEIQNKDYKNSYDILVSFGGDGTILKSARIAKKLNIPIFGINAGTLGFLTSAEGLKNIDIYLDKIINKNFMYDNRYMLDVKVKRNDKIIFSTYAVNEATITTKSLIKMGQYDVKIGEKGKVFNEYRADGLIVSTPTGSTGHSFSAGGPIVAPDVSCFIITAICPHAFNQRSIIISDKEEVYIENKKDFQIVDVDGRESMDLLIGDVIIISLLKKPIKYIIFEDNHFINNIKCKIKNI